MYLSSSFQCKCSEILHNCRQTLYCVLLLKTSKYYFTGHLHHPRQDVGRHYIWQISKLTCALLFTHACAHTDTHLETLRYMHKKQRQQDASHPEVQMTWVVLKPSQMKLE